MYLEDKFLSTVHAIESYHRRTMKNFELPEKQHKKRIEEILNAVPHEHKDWLENKLAYSNEPGLRRRLKEILEKFADVLNDFIPDKDLFIHKVVTTRNYLIHYDEKLKEQSAKREELYYLTQKIKILIEICLLKELGFTSDNIKSLISRNRRYQREIRIV
jgi:predicted secreted protein